MRIILSNRPGQLHTGEAHGHRRAWLLAIVLPACIAVLAGCQSSSQQLVGPSGTKCDVSVPASLPAVGADGGSGTLTITAARECSWSVASGASWISLTSNGTGQGPGSVSYAAAINPTPTIRRGSLTVGERQVELVQEAAPCRFTFTPSELTVDADGGESAITVSTMAGCSWTSVSEANWIAISGAAEGSGPGSVRLRIEANEGADRTGRVSIGGQTYTVSQRRATAPECSATLSATTATVEATAGAVSVSVSVASACTWTAASQVPWITVTRGGDGSGIGTVDLSVAANTGAGRVGTVRIAGQTYTVTQSASPSTPSCSYALESSSPSVVASGATIRISVTTSNGCAWTAASQVPWISVTAGAQSSGSAAVDLTVAANTGGARSGLVVIAGQTVTVTQAGAASPQPCSFTLGSTSQQVAGAGGSVSVAVSAASGCAWTAASQASWITIANGSQGTGNGTVSLTVASHTGPERTGVVTIAGETFTVTQAAGSSTPTCTYAIGSSAQSVPAAGGPVTVSVTASAGCAWTALSELGWITVESGAQGSGSGTVILNVAVNAGAERSGSVTIAGRAFTVTQAAAAPSEPPCSYNLSATAADVTAAATALTVGVTTASSCSWTATSHVSWIEVTEGGNGKGNKMVRLSVAANTGPRRVGTLTIAGHTFTVTQAAPEPTACTYSIDPREQAVSSLGGAYTVTVTTQAGCAWSGTSNVSWIEINGNRSGTGSGVVTYRVQIGGIISPREGTLTIAGQTLTVRQALLPVTGGP